MNFSLNHHQITRIFFLYLQNSTVPGGTGDIGLLVDYRNHTPFPCKLKYMLKCCLKCLQFYLHGSDRRLQQTQIRLSSASFGGLTAGQGQKHSTERVL